MHVQVEKKLLRFWLKQATFFTTYNIFFVVKNIICQ